MRNRQALIDKLMFSEGPADQIVASHKRDLQEQAEAAAAQAALSSVPRQRHTQFSSGMFSLRSYQPLFSEFIKNTEYAIFKFCSREFQSHRHAFCL